MPRYAEIAVDSFVQDGLGIFDYIIPDIYDNIIKEGMRVVVPFGKNSKEGYIIKIKDSTDIDNSKLKYIKTIPDMDSCLSPSQLELSKWMSDEYACNLIDFIKCIFPPEVGLKENKYIVLNKDIKINKDSLPKNEKLIIDEVEKSRGRISIKKLNSTLKYNTSKHIKGLTKKSIIKLETKMDSSVRDKTVKVVRLAIKREEAIKKIDDLKGKRQLELLNIILGSKDDLQVKYISDVYGISRSTIDTLVNKGILEIIDMKIERDPYGEVEFAPYTKPVLTKEQVDVIDTIQSEVKRGRKGFLIHGVTGSGKTEVYMELIENVIKSGKQAIMLVPEISLTPQTIERFKGRFKRVAVLHSRLSSGERYDEWTKILQGEKDVVVGARSAVFAPLNNLGIIIIDEEHENSYKSDKTPKYNTIDVAYKRCEIEDAYLVLGSATPSIETYYNAQLGKLKLCTMKKRVDNRSMPKMELVDMRQEIIEGNKTIFSRALYEGIKKAIEKKGQIILFLNRRGFSTFVSCRKCGLVMKCPRCDVSLTYHMYEDRLSCHYCGYSTKSPKICPKCKSKYIKYFGIGTQKIESEVKRFFPEAKVLRMDMDTTSKKGSHEKIYNKFKNQEADILIGTQMISKGLDFPNVTLVGIIAADQSLYIPDFKSCERTFQLITQVSGRAGRGEKEGKVIVQTYDPDNYSIVAALHQDYSEFYNKELIIRETFNYPPFSDIINIVVSSKYEDEAIKAARDITDKLRAENPYDGFEILGPSPANISKINLNYRWQTIIKCNVDKAIKNNLRSISNNYNGKSVKISIDINPASMM